MRNGGNLHRQDHLRGVRSCEYLSGLLDAKWIPALSRHPRITFQRSLCQVNNRDENSSFAPPGIVRSSHFAPTLLRRGLHSFAASWLVGG